MAKAKRKGSKNKDSSMLVRMTTALHARFLRAVEMDREMYSSDATAAGVMRANVVDYCDRIEAQYAAGESGGSSTGGTGGGV